MLELVEVNGASVVAQIGLKVAGIFTNLCQILKHQIKNHLKNSPRNCVNKKLISCSTCDQANRHRLPEG